MSLREQQAALMAALAGHGPILAGWDAERVQAMAQALAHKRARSVCLAWPSLKDLLGDEFDARFKAYAAEQALPQHGGATADGRLFARWLVHCGVALSDAVQRQALSIDLRFAVTPEGWRARRGLRVGAAWLPEARQWMLALQLPGLRALSLHLFRRPR
jgi:hypothetical protein